MTRPLPQFTVQMSSLEVCALLMELTFQGVMTVRSGAVCMLWGLCIAHGAVCLALDELLADFCF
jgi:hypothetical protein